MSGLKSSRKTQTAMRFSGKVTFPKQSFQILLKNSIVN